jgi:sulfoxide reductase heme-binding subunit YedZ
MVTLILLTLSLALGVVQTVRWSGRNLPRFVTAALHRNTSLLAVVFLTIHIVTAVVDGFAPIRWLDAVVPFVSAYRPFWLGLGALATDLLIALVATSLVRRHLGYQTWRAVHWAAYACWPIALLHGLGTGTDTNLRWALILNFVCLAMVLTAVWWRLAVGWPSHLRVRSVALVASIILPITLVVWVRQGPLAPGWARRAGTPSSLISTNPARPSS